MSSNERGPVDELAQLIRRIDGNHDLGAGALAEAIIDAGYFKADHIEYAADHPNSIVDFTDDDGYHHWRDRRAFEDYYSDSTATLKQRHVGPLVDLEPAR